MTARLSEGKAADFFHLDVFFDSGHYYSDSVEILGRSIRGAFISIPSGWTDADIAFFGSNEEEEPAYDDTSWEPIYMTDVADAPSLVLMSLSDIATSAKGCYPLPVDAWVFGSFRWLKLEKRNTSSFGSTVNQSGDLTCVLRCLE